MPNYKRAFIPGGTFFFTVITHRRRKLFHLESNRQALGKVIRECQREYPFQIDAIVLLPDHLHTIWTLPRGDSRNSDRWNMIKRKFSQRFLAVGGADWKISSGKTREGRKGIWQRRFWEHAIEDEDDFEVHFDYIHFNPVKHGYVKCPRDWPASSFHRWVTKGVYELNWACGSNPVPGFPTTEGNYGEPG